MKWVCGGLSVIVSLSSILANYNPYKRDLDLLYQEPFSGPYTKNEVASVEELWLDQRVDHFDEKNNGTWKMVGYRMKTDFQITDNNYEFLEIFSERKVPQSPGTHLHICGR